MTDQGRAVGIDLGTTHCALAHASLDEDSSRPPAILDIPQLLHAGEVASRPLLPSFIYLPGEVELPEGALALPWDSSASLAAGHFAREQGAKVPTRLISSAKSWLSYAGVDRRAPILPWQAPEEVPSLSPLEASARFLQHLRCAWDHSNPDSPLAEQDILLTVPASFDAVARELTVEAARLAGLAENLTLIEEPQAALYSWLVSQGDDWRRQVEVGDLILVCDIGGGTTDLSLISVGEENGSLTLERVAVGDHILLGGDNMDLALAFAIRARLEAEGKTLDDWRMRALTHGCRVAKEALLADPDMQSHPVAIAGRGARLIGSTIRTELPRELLEQTLVDGFFPRVTVDARPAAPRRVGLSTLGLPYAQDPAITRHLASFLCRQATSGQLPPEMAKKGHSFLHPTAILFNGGVTKSSLLRQRIVSIIDSWLEADGGRGLRVLEGADPDLAVARGAAYYGKVRKGRGIRIRGGTVRAYYVGIERAELAVPGIPPRIDAVCVAPFGMEEGSEVVLPQPLGLVVGEAASFRFFSSSSRRNDAAAAVVDPSSPGAGLEELPPIETTLEGNGERAAGALIPVKLHARLTEVGTLELSAEEEETGRRWRLEYNVRVE